MKNQVLHLILGLMLVVSLGFLLIFSFLVNEVDKVFALPNNQASLTPTPFFRFPVVPNTEISGLFDHNGTYPDTSNQYVTFYNERESTSDNGFQFTCPIIGGAWVGCEIEASSEIDCPNHNELWYDTHHGIDYEYASDWHTGDSCDTGKFNGITHSVYSPAKGKVDFAGLDNTRPANGYHIIILHDLDEDGDYDNDGLRSFYLHFEDNGIAVVKDDIVEEGQYLGEGGMTGLAWTPHLHFEVQQWEGSINDWVPVDPYGWQGSGSDPWPYDNYSLWRYDAYLPLVLKAWPPVPDIPTLNPINNPNYTNTYTLTWNTTAVSDTYILQEANTLDFNNPITYYTDLSTTWVVTNALPASFYYRVKAQNRWATSQWSNIQQTTVLLPPGWHTITSLDFESSLPSEWSVLDYSGNTDGDYRWASRDCRIYTDNYSGWAVGGGNDGINLSCGSNYPANAISWIFYGPFSLQNSIAAEFNFNLWYNTETNYDYVFWGASTDGLNFQGDSISGNGGGWGYVNVDFAQVPNIGNLLGETNVWVAIVFESDSTVSRAEGVYVDDIIIRQCMQIPCLSAKEYTNTPKRKIIGTPATKQR